MTYGLGIIGAGMMAEAIVGGVLKSGALKPGEIIAADVSADRRNLFQTKLGVAAVEDNAIVAGQASTILLSVKPYQMEAALAGIGAAMSPDTLVISIAAGISSGFIEKHLGQGRAWRVIRSMPNTPMLVGAGMVAIAPGTHATANDLALARKLFSAAAVVLETSEDKIDAVTAVSGSGPAYFFFLVEQMIRAGVEMGLSADEGRTLAIQTAVGSAKMMSESSDAPAEHRRRVTTPNGTTHAAISKLESDNWPTITIDALKAAAQRSRELGK